MQPYEFRRSPEVSSPEGRIPNPENPGPGQDEDQEKRYNSEMPCTEKLRLTHTSVRAIMKKMKRLFLVEILKNCIKKKFLSHKNNNIPWSERESGTRREVTQINPEYPTIRKFWRPTGTITPP